MKRVLPALLALLFLSSPLQADRPWSEIRGRDVTVFGAQPPQRLRDVAVDLEQFRSVLGRLVPGARQPQSVPTEVYVFDDAGAMRAFVPLYQGRPSALGGYCICGASDEVSFIAVARSRYQDSSAIVYHEYTHLLLRSAIRDVPVWLNEGLAEYFSTFALRGNGREAQVGRPIERHLEVLQEAFIPLAQLLNVDRSSDLYNEGTRRSIFYAEAWAFTHYLLLGRPDGAAIVDRYLAVHATGKHPDEALVEAAGAPLAELEAGLRRYVGRMLFNAATYTLPDPVAVDQPSGARTLDSAEAQARLGTLQLRVGRMEEGARRIEAAAASGPRVGQAQLALALLRLRQHRDEEAAALLKQTVLLAPDDFTAQYLYALTLLRGDGEPDANSNWPADRARAAHDALARALRRHPDSAGALAWLAYADMQRDADLAEARAATLRAIALAPGRLDYRLQLAEIQIRMGDTADARRLLATLASAGGDDYVPGRAKVLLAMLDRRQQQ